MVTSVKTIVRSSAALPERQLLERLVAEVIACRAEIVAMRALIEAPRRALVALRTVERDPLILLATLYGSTEFTCAELFRYAANDDSLHTEQRRPQGRLRLDAAARSGDATGFWPLAVKKGSDGKDAR
jgi:hypothetical protein